MYKTQALSLKPANKGNIITVQARKGLERRLERLQKEGHDSIYLEIECNGGEIEEGLKLYRTIGKYKGEVVCDIRKALSMGLIIVQAARVRRAYPDATLMFHEVHASFKDYTITDIKGLLTELRQDQKTLCEILASRTKRSVRYWMSCKEDTYFSPREALRIGLIDEINE